jgi:dTDP-4-dehydrorhamnose 3,5-epimerase-like enzyme
MGIDGARIINLKKISDPKGNLTPIEARVDVPFDIRRVYYTYDIPGGETRGGHAHRELEEFIVAASGSFDVIIDDGVAKERYFLNRSYYGLYVPRLIWRELANFSSGSVCLVLASAEYDEEEYIRDPAEFASIVAGSAG